MVVTTRALKAVPGRAPGFGQSASLIVAQPCSWAEDMVCSDASGVAASTIHPARPSSPDVKLPPRNGC